MVSVEVNPAPGLDPSKRARGRARCCSTSGVDIVNVADAPRAVARMSNLAFCSLLLERYGIQPILHVCGRDRNLLGQMAHLLGAHAIGIRNLVIITGDPPKIGDYPEATAVYDLDAIGLLQMASGMNRGVDPAGKPLPGGQTSFLLATGVEPGAADLDKEIRRLERKKAAGAELVMTQPIYQTDAARAVAPAHRAPRLPVLVGVLPLVSYKNAEFLHNEVPGMQIPAEIRERMRKTPGRRGRAPGRRPDRPRDALRGARPRPGRLPHAAARPLRARARGPRRPEAVAGSRDGLGDGIKRRVDLDRDRLREISLRLLALHKLLLDRERRVYESRHGAAAAADLLRLLLQDEQFAWLRPLSRLAAEMDGLVDSDDPLSEEVAQQAYRDVYRLLASGERGVFQDKYRDALQESPDVVMAHANIRSVLPVGDRER